jgi:hypothetical protein
MNPRKQILSTALIGIMYTLHDRSQWCHGLIARVDKVQGPQRSLGPLPRAIFYVVVRRFDLTAWDPKI